jgi:hypothetical protein
MPVAAVIAEDDIVGSEGGEHTHRIRFLAQVGMSCTGKYS